MVSTSMRIRQGNSLRIIMILLVVVAISAYLKLPANLVLIKLLVVPMFWLASIGIPNLYKDRINEQPLFSLNVIEYHFLFALILTGFLVLLLWTPDMMVSTIIYATVFGLITGTLLGLLMSFFERKRA